MSDWQIFTGDGTPSDRISALPGPPSWRRFDRRGDEGGLAPLQDEKAVMMVNAALLLRRPLLVTGPPGSGKSTLATLVARELDLGPVLRWPITTSSRLQDALYMYDAIGRVHDANYSNGTQREADIGRYIRLGPLGTALLPSDKPRVLLIDEIDKSDIDLPSDLLHVFEEGEFTIKELERLRADDPGNPGTGNAGPGAAGTGSPDGGSPGSGNPGKGAVATDQPGGDAGENGAESGTARPDDAGNGDPGISVRTADNSPATVREDGVVRCTQFPFVLMTSNGERTFPAPFLRRCLRLELTQPKDDQLRKILDARIPRDPGEGQPVDVEDLVGRFQKALEDRHLVTSDQLLNAVFIAFSCQFPDPETKQSVMDALFEPLG